MVEFTCLAIHDACGPAVVRCAVAFAQGADDILKAELISHLVKNVNIASQLQLTGGNICITRLEAQNLLSILFISNAHVHILHQVGHNLLCLLGRPQFLTEV